MDRLRKAASLPCESAVTSTPSKAMLPLVGTSRLPKRCSSVDLPTPEAPTMETREPGGQIEVDAAQDLDAPAAMLEHLP